jgi:hypothetical protein
VLGLALILVIAGCARPVGDFGRASDSVLHDEVLPGLGGFRAAQSGEPVSVFNLAYQEKEMRDRVWRYLGAPHARDWFYDTMVELERTRVAPHGTFKFKTDLYYLWLASERFASSQVRYSRLKDDIEADVGAMSATFGAICVVEGMNRQRRIAGDGIEGLEPAMLEEAADREAENDLIVGWFTRSVGYRYDSYSYALDHLLVETPHEEAIAVDAALSEMAIQVEAAGRDDFCSANLTGAGADDDSSIRSRYLANEPSEGPYSK